MRIMTKSLWQRTPSARQYPALHGRQEVDVVIVGAGLTGITAAYCLKRAGQRVAVLDQHHVGAGETGHTTAHITAAFDTSYSVIAGKFGLEAAQLVYEANRAAMQFIGQQISTHSINCGFESVPAYLYATDHRQVRALQAEFEIAQKIGFTAVWIDRPELPFDIDAIAAIRFPDQAQFNPISYLQAIAGAVEGGGSHIFENSRVEDFHEGKPCVIKTASGEVRATKAIFATNIPIVNRLTIPAEVAPYRTYAIAAPMPAGFRLNGLYWDMDNPYHYIRMQEDMLIVGGEDHKTGTNPVTVQAFANLEAFARRVFPLMGKVSYRWSGQVLEPADGLPYIGQAQLHRNYYIATGYSGNGMTFATVAGLLLTDKVLGRGNPWSEVFSPSRFKPLASAGHFISENKDYPLCLLRDRFAGTEARLVEEIPVGEGRVMRIEGKKVAVYKDPKGGVQCVSAVCTHMGCQVRFNRAEISWDCPCHGSRFATDGSVLNGPAIHGLCPSSTARRRIIVHNEAAANE